MDDALAREFLVALLLGVALAATLGGHWPRLSGTWHDGAQPVTLLHVGALVWGISEPDGGTAHYRGVALHGHVWLWRWDRGASRLRALGFPASCWHGPRVRTARFELVLRGDGALSGAFFGMRFVQERQGMRPAGTLEPQPRLWTRAAPRA